MTLMRLLLFCVCVAALAAQPARAALPCHTSALQHQTQMATPCNHAPTKPQAPRHGCPGAMACCAPIAVRTGPPTLALRTWRPRLPERLARERAREDATRDSPLRPPRAA